MYKMAVILTQQENGNWDVYIAGNEQNENNNLPYQAAISRAKDVMQNKKKTGYIILEYLDGKTELKSV